MYIYIYIFLDDSEGHSYGQLVIGSFITTTRLLVHHISCRVFWWNIKSPRWLSPPTAQIWLQLLAFPKTKVTFEREEISDHWWDSGKYDGAVDGDGRTVWGPRVPTLKGTEVFYSVFCIFNKCVYIHIAWQDTFWTDLVCMCVDIHFLSKYRH